MEHYQNCVMCRRGLYRRRYQQHVLVDNLPQMRPDFAAYIQEHAILQVVFDNTRSMCHRCWQRIENAIRPLPEPPLQPPPLPSPPLLPPPPPSPPPSPPPPEPVVLEAQAIHVPEYKRAPNTPRHCIFNNCPNGTRHRIPDVIKVHMFCEYKLYIPDGARVCLEHLHGNHWDELPEFCDVTHDFSAAQFKNVCDMLRDAVRRGGPRLDFSVRGALSNDEMHFWTGFNGDQFDAILEQTPSLSENCANPRVALGIYLTKLRTGDSDKRLATLFQMSRTKLRRFLTQARDCLTTEYVPLHLGLDHIDRNNILERNLRLPRGLFGNDENTKAIIIFDGTYLYIHKSSNFLFQRQTYSLHKFQNLLKPFLLVTTDGYIIDVKGPYAATKSDADIMSDQMNNEENPIHWLLQQNDVFILDRGFRDSLRDIEACGYEFHVPPTKNRHETQLTTEKANESRMVTIVRWVVEVVNGRFKRDFKLLRQKYFNNALRHMFKNFKIAAALLNHFHVPIADSAYAEEFLRIIQVKRNSPNILHNYVERKRLNSRRADFVRLEASEIQFPHMTEEDVILLSLGTYQLKLAKSYCSEHLQNGLYLIETYRENALEDLPDYGIDESAWLLRGRIQSRHTRSRLYYCYLLINNENNNILQHYCTCLTGRRTIGTCAHIVSIVWYLGYARREGIRRPALFLNDVLIIDEE